MSAKNPNSIYKIPDLKLDELQQLGLNETSYFPLVIKVNRTAQEGGMSKNFCFLKCENVDLGLNDNSFDC